MAITLYPSMEICWGRSLHPPTRPHKFLVQAETREKYGGKKKGIENLNKVHEVGS